MNYVKKYLQLAKTTLENIVFIDNKRVCRKNHLEENLLSEATMGARLKKIELERVKHTDRSCGIVITHRKGYKIVYSGDTRPSKKLTRVGKFVFLFLNFAYKAYLLVLQDIVSYIVFFRF